MQSFASRWPRLRWPNAYTIAGVSRAGVQATTLLTMMVAIAALDTTTFGAFSVAWVAAVMGNTLVYSGLYEYLLRTRDVEAEKHAVFWLMAAEGVLFGSLMLLAGVVAYAAGNAPLGLSFSVLAAVSFLVAPMAWCDALLTRAGRAATVGVVVFVAELCGALALAAGLALGFKLAALLAWRVVSTCVAFGGLFVLGNTVPRPRWSTDIARSALAAALPLQGGTLVRTISTYAADFLLAWHLSPAAAGSYRAASRVSVTGSDVFLQPLRPMTWASLARHEREANQLAMRTVYLDQLRMLTFFTWPVLLCVALFSTRLFATLAKADWISAAPVLVVLALSRLPAVLDYFFDPILVCTGKTGTQFRMRTAFTVVLLIGILISAIYGPMAVAWWQLVFALLTSVIATSFIARAISVTWHQVISATAPAVVVAVLCAVTGELVFRVTQVQPTLRLIISVAAMGACLLGCFVLLQRRAGIRLPTAEA